jgi:hypothetical protein
LCTDIHKPNGAPEVRERGETRSWDPANWTRANATASH